MSKQSLFFTMQPVRSDFIRIKLPCRKERVFKGEDVTIKLYTEAQVWNMAHDCLSYCLERFHDLLDQALKNQLELPVPDGVLGGFYNIYAHDQERYYRALAQEPDKPIPSFAGAVIRDDDGSSQVFSLEHLAALGKFLLWEMPAEQTQWWLYQKDGEVYLQGTPVIAWGSSDEAFSSYLSSSHPLVLIKIPRLIVQRWFKQVCAMLETLEVTYQRQAAGEPWRCYTCDPR